MAMIYLIRHGQASFLKHDYDKLSDLGMQQSQILGQALLNRNQTPSIIAGGNLVRHKETADHCLQAFDQSFNTQVDQRWNEYDHMELLGKHDSAFTDYSTIGEYLKKQDNPMRVLQKVLNDSIEDWIAAKYDYSLSWQEFKQGVWEALNDVASKLGSGESAWVFTSGGPISAILIQLLSLEERQFVDLQGRLVNSSITKVLVGKNKLSLSTYNEYSHLDHNAELITYR
ncbi:histidine phosphatase family protein [Ekhidna sp. To15]|uniref:histidine phosphatase family protein n=1 Tax=Ekhidna sp. To15 TaxID=3395267 RepID=UPI003F526903